MIAKSIQESQLVNDVLTTLSWLSAVFAFVFGSLLLDLQSFFLSSGTGNMSIVHKYDSTWEESLSWGGIRKCLMCTSTVSPTN